MGGAVVVRIGINSVAPASAPLVRLEALLERGRRIAWRQLHRVAVQQEGEPAIGNGAVVHQPTSCDSSGVDKGTELSRQGCRQIRFVHARTYQWPGHHQIYSQISTCENNR